MEFEEHLTGIKFNSISLHLNFQKIATHRWSLNLAPFSANERSAVQKKQKKPVHSTWICVTNVGGKLPFGGWNHCQMNQLNRSINQTTNQRPAHAEFGVTRQTEERRRPLAEKSRHTLRCRHPLTHFTQTARGGRGHVIRTLASHWLRLPSRPRLPGKFPFRKNHFKRNKIRKT